MPEYRPAAGLIAALAIVLFAACASDGTENPDVPSATPASVPPTAGGSGVCTRPIPPLTTTPISRERLEAAVGKMDEVQQAANAGDAAAASAAFAGDTHDITHDIDQPLRATDAPLAQDLCESILFLEHQFPGAPDLPAVAEEAQTSAALLRESGRALGLID